MHCYQALVCYSAIGHLRTTYPELIGTPGQHGSPPRSWWCPVVGMYRLQPNWWVQSGAGECKGLRPALPIHHTTVVLRCSYPAAVHRPSAEVYIYLCGHHWTWGYNHSSALVFKVRKHINNLTSCAANKSDIVAQRKPPCLMLSIHSIFTAT